jgi:hypothetical protein
MTLNEKLIEIQTRFKSKKSRFNSFGKYHFRSAEDILEATKPFLKELGVSVLIKEELVTTDPSPILKATAIITDGESTEEATAIVGVDLNQKGMQVPQQFGSASSYGKKYALGNLFLIDDTQDSDATNAHGKDKAKDSVYLMTASALEKAKEYVSAGGDISTIKTKYELTPEQEAILVAASTRKKKNG